MSQYLGAAIAVELFDDIDAPGVALLRVVGAAVALVLFRRSWQRAWTRSELWWAAAFGSVLAGMNLSFYLAIERLPLGNAVAIEFLGPVAVAAVGARSVRAGAALALAVGGVVLLAEVQPEGSAGGIGFALLAGALWAGYIVLGHRVARVGGAVDGLGVGMFVGALVIAPFGVADVGPALSAPWLLALALSTGVLSNSIPYAIDQVVLARLSRARFAFLQAMLPLTATLVGLVALRQTPTPSELAGIGLVVVAIVLGFERNGASREVS